MSTGQGILGSNTFSYCQNNPIIYIDISGTSLAGALRNTHEGFMRISGSAGISAEVVGGTLGTIAGIGLASYLSDIWDEFERSIGKATTTAKSSTSYKSETEVHHMVAKGSYKATEARTILEAIFPLGVEAPENKVELKTSFHKHVHTNLYYATVNSIVVYAYESADGDMVIAEANVRETLGAIQATLLVLNSQFP